LILHFLALLTLSSRHRHQGRRSSYRGARHTPHPLSAHSGSARHSHHRHGSPMVVCGVDVCLSAVVARLELCAPDICVLEV
jgi:hypothetical protein